ncbi:MAG: PepSY-like domain-containing protein [Duncaniella sp.]
MKKFLLFLMALLCLGGAAKADSYNIDRDKLPVKAREMIEEYFPKAKIGMIKVDKHLFKKTDYDVKLVNGTKIEFNNAGKWTSVDCKNRQVPDGLVMRTIHNYVKKNCNGAFITKIENKLSGYEIELSDGVEMKFNKLGKLTHTEVDD